MTETTAEAVAKVCAGLDPGLMVPELGIAVDRFSDLADDELTLEQSAMRKAFNKEIRDGERHMKICPVKKED